MVGRVGLRGREAAGSRAEVDGVAVVVSSEIEFIDHAYARHRAGAVRSNGHVGDNAEGLRARRIARVVGELDRCHIAGRRVKIDNLTTRDRYTFRILDRGREDFLRAGRVDGDRACAVRDRDARSGGQRIVDERGAVADQQFAVLRNGREIRERSRSSTASGASSGDKRPVRGTAARAGAVVILRGRVRVPVQRDEIELVVTDAGLPLSARVERLRLGELLAKLVDLAGPRETSELCVNDSFDRLGK